MAVDTVSMPSAPEINDFLAAFDLDHANIKDISFFHQDGELRIELELNTVPHHCPVCNALTAKVKGYQYKRIRHSIFNPTPCTIVYHARRYVCPICGKTFYENNPFTADYLKISQATVYNVLQELRIPSSTFKSTGDKYHISPSTVSNIFDRYIHIDRRPLPECLCFDETYAFKSDDSDYICVLLDYANKKIIDILPSRRKRYLSDYFFSIPIEERRNVRYVSYDMWFTYREIASYMFPNSCGILDKFHVLQELSRRVSRVRVDVMNKYKKIKDDLEEKNKILKDNHMELNPEDQEKLKNAQISYYLLKKFNFVLFSNNEKITDPNAEKKYNKVLGRYLNLYDIYDLIIRIDKNLKEAVEINDEVRRFYKKCSYENAKEELEKIIIHCRTSNVKAIHDFSNTLTNWKPEIINSFIIIPSINKKMNNGLIENRNKTIKLIKNSSNGYTCWSRFRSRVLYCLNDDVPISGRKKGGNSHG